MFLFLLSNYTHRRRIIKHFALSSGTNSENYKSENYRYRLWLTVDTYWFCRPYTYEGEEEVAVKRQPPQPTTLDSEPQRTQAMPTMENRPLRPEDELSLNDEL